MSRAYPLIPECIWQETDCIRQETDCIRQETACIRQETACIGQETDCTLHPVLMAVMNDGAFVTGAVDGEIAGAFGAAGIQKGVTTRCTRCTERTSVPHTCGKAIVNTDPVPGSLS